MRIQLPLFFFVFLLGCTPASIDNGSIPNTSNSLTSSNPTSISFNVTSLSSSIDSSPSLSTSSSMSLTSQTSSSSPTSISLNVSSSSSAIVSSGNISTTQASQLATIWLAPMALNNAIGYYGENLALTASLTQVKVTIAHAVYQADRNLYGIAYEAIVNGNGGSNSIRFRVGIVNQRFVGFTMVSHREHSGFGLKIIQALVSQLPGKPATSGSIQEVLVAANATRTGISETYDGMIPALQAILIHYQGQIS